MKNTDGDLVTKGGKPYHRAYRSEVDAEGQILNKRLIAGGSELHCNLAIAKWREKNPDRSKELAWVEQATADLR